MDWLLKHLEALQETVFFAVAGLLSVDIDFIFFDNTFTSQGHGPHADPRPY